MLIHRCVALGASALGCVSLAASLLHAQPSQDSGAAVVIIERRGPTGDVPALGFLIGADRVVTARHCLEGVSDARINMGADGMALVLGVVADDARLDVAILKIASDRPPPRVLSWMQDRPTPGQPAIALGRALVSGALEQRAGFVEEMSGGTSVAPPYILTTINGGPGDSGCPLVDADGRALGVITATSALNENAMVLAVPAHAVAAMPLGEPRPIAEWWTPQEVSNGSESRHALHEGIRRLLQGDTAGAVPHLRRSVALNPESRRAWEALVRTLHKADRRAEAEELVRAAIEASPARGFLWVLLGHLLRGRDDLQGAVDAYREAVSRAPTVEAYVELSAGLALSKRREEAARALEEAAALDPSDPLPWVRLGRLYFDDELPDGAINAFKRAAAADPWAADPHRYLANLYVTKDLHQAALDSLDNYVRLRPRDSTGHRGRGILLSRFNRTQEAIDAFSRSLALASDDEETLYWLTLCYHRLGQREAAWEQLQRLEKVSPYRANRLRLLMNEADLPLEASDK